MPPSLDRRHAAGGASARSLLLTVLGEFVLPGAGPVWTQAIVHALGLLGVTDKAARQALARTARDGWCDSDQVGRRVRWSLTPAGKRLLSQGAERIYSFGSDPAAWDGQWLVLLVSVPEARRAVRHRLRTRLSWAGFGSPEPGVWVCPHRAHETEAATALHELGLHTEAMSFTARFAGIGREQAMVSRAWDLDALGARYQRFFDLFAATRPAAGDPTLAAQLRLVHEWRRFVFLDPGLPADLLPRRWPGTRAAALFHRRHTGWRDAAQARWSSLHPDGGAG